MKYNFSVFALCVDCGPRASDAELHLLANKIVVMNIDADKYVSYCYPFAVTLKVD